jgi:hypothetical protein
MEIDTRYATNLFFPNSAFIQIYFEAVANSLDAEADDIRIHISTDGNIKPAYLEIKVTDNGQGFTDERFERFRLLKEPVDSYHKGLGRLVYLHYFKQVNVESFFSSQKRSFVFSEDFNGDSDLKKAKGKAPQGTSLTFRGFLRERLRSYDDLKPGHLKLKIIEHFLPLLHTRKKSGKEFKISIKLETQNQNLQKGLFPDEQTITVSDIPEFKNKTFKDQGVHAFFEINMSYVLRQGWGEKSELTAACVDGRTMPLKLLGPNSIPANHSAIFLFESDLFSGKSDSSRQRLVLPENISEAALYRRLRKEMSLVLRAPRTKDSLKII